MTSGVGRLGQILVLVALFAFALTSGSARAVSSAVTPNHVNMLDCNGWSASYQSVKAGMRDLCTDFFINEDGESYRGSDNGHYVGHDEPSVKFISSAANSGNTMTYFMQLGVDPKPKPTPDGKVTDYAELSVAPWFGLPMCDGKSYPQNPCTPDSDANSGAINDPNSAGSAFMELQFYPPGFGPFKDAVSCDAKSYCAALTIDSLECTFGFATCNNNCIEPVDFAYLQRDGVPAGPPSPQLADDTSIMPNGQTLKMKPGDPLKVTIADTPDGLRVEVDDLKTHQIGFMVASAANGFQNTNIADCSGTPFAFHAEYNTAKQQNQVPWAALEGGVLMQQEIGHFESCDSVTNTFGIPFDPQTFQTCVGGLEPGTGEGPCDPSTGVCQGATTEGGAACPSNNFNSGQNCEFSDATCVPKGPRPVTLAGVTTMWNWPVAGCLQNAFQNGDLDFDGNGYRPLWPDGSPDHPRPFSYAGPFDASGNPYPTIQIESNVGASEILCNVNTGAGCTEPPTGAAFYPFWTLGKQKSPFGPPPGPACFWNFGNSIAHVTTDNLGGDAEYGSPDTARFAGTSITPPMPNPQLNASCTA